MKTTAHTRQCHRLSRTSRQRRGNSDSTRNTLLNSHRTTIRQRIVKRDWSCVETACLRDDKIGRASSRIGNEESVRSRRDRRRNIDREDTRESRRYRDESETATGETSRKTTAHKRQSHRLSRTSRQRRGNSDSTRNTLLNSHRTTIRQRIVKRDWSSVEPACLRDDNIKPTSIKDMVDRGSARRRLWEGDTATASGHHLVGNSEEQKRTNRKATRRKSVMGNTRTIITTTNIERA